MTTLRSDKAALEKVDKEIQQLIDKREGLKRVIEEKENEYQTKVHKYRVSGYYYVDAATDPAGWLYLGKDEINLNGIMNLDVVLIESAYKTKKWCKDHKINKSKNKFKVGKEKK